MSMALVTILAQIETQFREPRYFAFAVLAMLVLGGVLSLVAAVLGFARARAFGSPARWFSFAAVCLVLFHVQFIALGFGMATRDNNLVFGLLTFFNVFVILAAACTVMGFIRLTSPR